MTNARDRVLADIRRALGHSGAHTATTHPVQQQERTAPVSPDLLIPVFAERVAEYKAWVGECDAAAVAAVVQARLVARGRSFVAAEDFPTGIVTEEFLVRDVGLSYEAIAATDGVVSLAAVGIAQTGTIVLDGGQGQGRRAITLLPDFHLCIIRADQIVADVPAAIAAVQKRVMRDRSPLTFISGPSATSDIELNRVEGVHGPRQLEVLIVR